MAKGGVVTNIRTMWYDESLRLAEVVSDVESRGQNVNMTRTLRLYGLKFNDERSFSSKYRGEFGLRDGKTMWDITLKEMKNYMDRLIGFPIKGY